MMETTNYSKIVFMYLWIFVFDALWFSFILPADAVCSCVKSKCVEGTCYCEEKTAGHSCSIVVGPAPTAVESNSGKHFLFFDQKYVNWHTARETCTEFWRGTLAMPNTPEKHRFIYEAVRDAKIQERSSAIWLGFSDIHSEGNWVFENGDTVNVPPTFFSGAVTAAGVRVTLPSLNSTSRGERWHFYFTDTTAPSLDRDAMRTLCNRLGNGHLPVKLDHTESQRILAFARVRKIWLGMYLSQTGNLTSFLDEEGDPVFMPRAWYGVSGYPLPTPAQLSQYQNWAYPPEPNGRTSAGRASGATCVAFEPRGWHDEACDEKLKPVCAYGPFPFERWHFGGSKYSEPNNGFGDEDCGVMRLDVSPSMTSSHSDVLYEFWNDYECHLKFPFACETTFPKDCISYRGPHSMACMASIWKQYGCDKEGTDYPGKLSPATRRVLTSLNLLPLSWHFQKISDDALVDPDAQIRCYGTRLPTGCSTFNGPHNTQCLKDLWEDVGCGLTGYGYPGNASAMVNSSWTSLNLREISDDIKLTIASASTGHADSQLMCYGMIFPLGCTYTGPYSIECLRAVWNQSGCVQEGLRYPDKLSSSLLNNLNALNLVALRNTMLNTHNRAVSQAQAQLDCYGLRFPSPCRSFLGPRTDACHRTIWSEGGCLAEGTKIPGRLSRAENISVNRLNMRQFVQYVQTLVDRAPAGDIFSQTACYGIPFGTGCSSYKGPNPTTCYSVKWLGTGCLSAGRAYPQNVGGTAHVRVLNTLNLRGVSSYMLNIRNRANQGDRSAQIDCYGKAFPGSCVRYGGPHSLTCQVSVWMGVGCTSDGYRHPSRYSQTDNATINGMTIDQVLGYMKGIYDAAMFFKPGGQLNCYGFNFPLGCRSFSGPHTFQCRSTIWYRTGCLAQGYDQPSNVTGQQLAHINQMNLRQLLEHTTSIFYSAHNQRDARAQRLCFGMKFPRGCLTYSGPNSEACYKQIWEELGCLQEGRKHPSKLSPAENATLNALNLREVSSHMDAIKEKAHYHDSEAQLDCFGLTFSPGCIYFRGPHPAECQKSIWDEVGCVEQGYKAFDNLTGSREAVQRNAMTLVQLRSYMTVFYTKAMSGDPVSQLNCFGLTFPHGCDGYAGPNSDVCYNQIWKEVGCLPEGHAHPSKVTPSQNATLNALTIRGVENHTRTMKSKAEAMDPQAQLYCFGVEFPDDCIYYRGPHEVDCLTAMWEDVGCLQEGDGAPGQLNSAELNAINQLDVVDLRVHMSRFKLRSERGFVQDQLLCYGMEFPTGCQTYFGPHSTDCYRSIWFKGGCVKSGYDFPRNLTKQKNDTLNRMNLREVENITEFVKNMSQYPILDVQSQLDCFGIVFPEGCNYYRGPHYLDCQEALWYEQGCIEEGYGHPANLTPSENATMNQMSIVGIRRYVQDLVKKSTLNHLQAQLKCFGLKFPAGCRRYRGPNSKTCYNSVWLSAGCLRGGLDYPSKITPAKNRTLNSLNLREIYNHTHTLTILASRSDVQAQLDCFGIEFLPGCVYYRGPHPIECQKSMWDDVDCLDEGFKHPTNLSESENDTMHTMNLRYGPRQQNPSFYFDSTSADVESMQMRSHMLNYSKMAELKGNVEAQLNCYGLKFPNGCKSYLGPNPIECYNSIWKQVGCLEAGQRYPDNLSYAMNQTLNSSDLREIESFIKDIKTRALWLNDTEPQLQCFGIVFPAGCHYYRGRHTIDCQKTIWKEQGCIEEGNHHPDNTTRWQRARLSKMTILQMQTHITDIRMMASRGDTESQLKCFGLKYLDGCKWYRGPNSVECYSNIWLDVGCVEQGWDHPRNLSFTKNNTLNAYNLRQVRTHIENISQDAIMMGNSSSQLDCYGIVFPKGCFYYRGPHAIQCQESFWNMVGCLKEGYSYPTNLTPSQNATLQSMDLNEIKLFMKNTTNNAEVLGDVDAQLKCYGMRFPFGCKTYRSPNHVDCYNSIWLKMGCVKEGRDYPAKLARSTIRNTFDNFDLRQAENYTMHIIYKTRGINGSEAQLDCFGIKFPTGCVFYRGPHTQRCQEVIWDDVGCLKQGQSFPGNLTPLQNDTLHSMNLVALRKHMENITLYAEVFGDVQAQFECFGLKFPNGCDTYRGPNSIECFSSIWLKAGCVQEGHQYPSNQSSTLNDTFFPLDQRQIEDHVLKIRLDALALNNQSQLDCFGLVFLPGCRFYRGPHPLECQKSMWKDVGCLDVGYKHPENISRHENWTINNKMNMVEFRQHMQMFTDMAHAGKSEFQLNCFGLQFPKGCKEYRGPHDAECYQTLWLESGCVKEGHNYPEIIEVAGNSTYYSGADIREVKFLMNEILNEALAYNNVTGLLKNQLRREDMLIEETLNSDLNQNAPLDNQSLAQLQCFGLVFPYGCIFYRGPHPEECQKSLWEDVGCLTFGYSFPDNLTRRQKKTRNALNVIDLRTFMLNISEKAESGDVQAQLDCCGMKFPNGCVSYRGPHVDECYQSVWLLSGCLKVGHGFPANVSNVTANVPRNESYADFDLRQLEDYTKRILHNALALNKTAQLECFGLEFPFGCTFFRGPHPERCQLSVWEEVGCVKLGYKHPGNITRRKNRTRNALNLFELRALLMEFHKSAHKGDEQAQLDCYGMKFPNGCKSYRGPNPVQCYDTIWLRVGCVRVGYDYPDNYSSSENAALNLLNLRQVEDIMESTLIRALTLNDMKAQLDCFGIVFSPGCNFYRGPHSLECQKSIWREKGCVPEGFKYPEKISPRENESINLKNLHEVNRIAQLMNATAIGGNQRDQLNCFGMLFPPNCKTYFGPHRLLCYNTIWEISGCEPSGYKYPGNVSVVEYDYLESLNLREVERYVQNISVEALRLKVPQAQLNCFGCVFPRRCTAFRGPHPLDCQETIWEDVGCVAEGWRAPSNLTPSENASINVMTLGAVKSLATHIYRSSLGGAQMAQLDCFGLRFPKGCTDYRGPNPLECYMTIWLEVGCVAEGLDSPRNFTSSENAMFNSYTLREVRDYIQKKLDSSVRKRDSQLDCFGFEFLKGCRNFRGPHSLQCLKSVWDSSRCLSEGLRHPDELTEPDTLFLDTLNLVELQEYFNNITHRAEKGSVQAQMDCYGLRFPGGCSQYYGPQPLSCHETIWVEEGCSTDGDDYPSRRTQMRNHTFDHFNIRDIASFTGDLNKDAHYLINRSQRDCFGMTFPSGCTHYHGPHPVACQISIWYSGGCVQQGFSFPANLTPLQNATVNSMNFVEYRLFVEELVNRSHRGNIDAQWECYGLKFPVGCDSYSIPHSIECHNTIWLQGGCIRAGHRFPTKSVVRDNVTHALTVVFHLPQLDIRGILAYTELIRRKAGSALDVQSQLDCFGFEFLHGCVYFRGPHSLACLNSIFTDVGCVLEGHYNANNLSAMQHAFLNYMNLIQLRQYQQSVLERALVGMKEYQLACYGMAFPTGCNTFEGPNTVHCYRSIWEMVGCKAEGHDYPDLFTSEENAVLHGYTLREVRNHMKAIKTSATPPDTRAQLDCYGFRKYLYLWLSFGERCHIGKMSNNCAVFPPGCKNYYGPHSMTCQKYFWRKAGCVPQGWHYPENLTYGDNVTVNRMTIPELEVFTLNYSLRAENGNTIDQYRCYGLKFANGCQFYRGPHRMECFINQWLDVGCIEKGLYYPKEYLFNRPLNVSDHRGHNATDFANFTLHQNDTNITPFYDELNLRELSDFMGNVSDDALSNNSLAQLRCFGLIFPPDCATYFGPHPRICVESVWLSMGCVHEGYCDPANLSGSKNATLVGMNLDDMIVFMRNLSNLSLMSHRQSQLNCYGMKFPNGCISYWGPHNVSCLNTLWQRSGCVEQGLAYPGKHIATTTKTSNYAPSKTFVNELIHTSNLTTNVTLYISLNDTFNTLHLRELHDLMTNITGAAIQWNNSIAQLECFGMVFLEGCRFYRGPHSHQCLVSYWYDVGCVPEGFHHPSNVSIPIKAMLTSMTLHYVQSYMGNFTFLAFDGNKEAQLECFGMKFPNGCSSYLGPHHTECLNTIWKIVGNVEEGLGYPGNLSSSKDDLMLALLTEYFNSTSTVAVMFPTTPTYINSSMNLTVVTTTTTLATTTAMHSAMEEFREATMNFSMFSKRNDTLNALHLRDVREYMENITEMALAGDPIAQLDSWGRVFLPGCRFFRGPHGLECLKAIWIDQGCVHQGYGYPENYTPSVNYTIRNMNIIEVEDYMGNFSARSLFPDVEAQLECYGLKFPNGCLDYRGPHKAMCLQSIWRKVGCVDEGLAYPQNLTVMLNRTSNYTLHTENLHYIHEHVDNLTDQALAMDLGPQMDCYGLVFPSHCQFFRGPHTLPCLVASWVDSGCLEQGYKNPDNLSVSEIGLFVDMTLHELKSYVENISKEAHTEIDSFPSRTAQLYCYGLIFPCGCFTFDPPHGIDCLTTLWERAGCVREGHSYPENLSSTDNLTLQMNSSNIVTILDIVENISTKALACDTQAQLDCYGIEFLSGCKFFPGPHSIECQRSMWEDAGCIELGLYHPDYVTPAQFAYFSSLNLHEGRKFFCNFSIQAHNGDFDAQLNCYGIKFLNGCTSYNGPHSIDCYISMWHKVGCVDEGYKYPGIMPAELRDVLDGCNLHEVQAYMQNITDEAHLDNGNAQMDCYGMAFPCDCPSFKGPHSLSCQQMIWSDAGCIPEGHANPSNLTRRENATINALTLRGMRDHMQKLTVAARNGNKAAQLQCYGMGFPRRCRSYPGPHSLECYVDLWFDAGCVEEGWSYPYNLSQPVIHYLDFQNLRILQEMFANVTERATTFSVQSQLECFGMSFACGCQYYRGPNSLECQISVYLSAGCIKEGFKYPSRLRPYQNASVINLNLRELKAHTENLRRLANGGDFQAQCECFGLGFPKECYQFEGPHSTLCYLNIWLDAGCKYEGYDQPENLTAQSLALLDSYNLHELKKFFDDVNDRANRMEPNALLGCRGRVYPKGCLSRHPPHTIQCLLSIWLGAGCEDIGYRNPFNLTGCENVSVHDMELDQVLTYYKNYTVRAHYPRLEDQLNCYGFEFPFGCVDYDGPNPVVCYKSIWKSSGCLLRGYGHPDNLTQKNMSFLNGMNLRAVQKHMKTIVELTQKGNDRSQLDCFGLEFPRNCTFFLGPHTLDCLIGSWKVAGCTEEGFGFPGSNNFPMNPALIYHTLHKVIEEMRNITTRAMSGDIQSQFACYGMEFLKKCSRYFGPHEDICIEAVWKQVGCSGTGYSALANLTNERKRELNTFNLRELEKYMRNISNRALVENEAVAQLECFGLKFPNGCKAFFALHPLECVNAVFESVNCIEDGNRYPQKLQPGEIRTFALMTLLEMTKAMQKIIDGALNNNIQDQLNCFGLELPDECKPFNKKLSLECFESLWCRVGCLSTGRAHPDKLNRHQLNFLHSLGLSGVIVYMQTTRRSITRSRSAQLDCVGTDFPFFCDNFYGPHSVECLNAMWVEAGCAKPGKQYPEKLQKDELTLISSRNLTEAMEFFRSKSKAAIDLPVNMQAQVECFGKPLVQVCGKFRGPYSPSCYKFLWQDAGCLLDGWEYQPNLTAKMNATMNAMNLYHLQAYMKNISVDAFKPNKKAQHACYGRQFPRGCKGYNPPHALQCVMEMFEEAGCIRAGTNHPMVVTGYQRDVILHMMNLAQLHDFYANFSRRAYTGDRRAQVGCFGSTFPSVCHNFRAPHSVQCLDEIWKLVGCTENGHDYPSNLSYSRLIRLNTVDLAQTRLRMKAVYDRAHHPHRPTQLACFGMHFPRGCTRFDGPHSVACQMTVWMTGGCTIHGLYYPPQICDARNASINLMNLEEVLEENKNISQSAIDGDKRSQVKCFGLEYPNSCTNFIGPHSYACKVQMWLDVGCDDQGYSHPRNLSTFENLTLNEMNLYELKIHMKAIYDKANLSDVDAQYKCFGKYIPKSCVQFEGPHSMECYIEVWQIVGCVAEGDEYPPKMSQARKRFLNDSNLNQITAYFYDFFNMSYFTNNRRAQLDCFGTTMVELCRYHPPMPMECLIYEWIEAGCSEYGYSFPPNVTLDEGKLLYSFTILEVREYMANISKEADDEADPQARLYCYGMHFPDGCSTYRGPHPLPCFITVWGDVGCGEKGFKHPRSLSYDLVRELSFYDLHTLFEYMRNISDLALTRDNQSQYDCYGRIIPEECSKFTPVLSLSCQRALWDESGCIKEGFDNPTNYTSEEQKVALVFNLDQITAFMDNVYKRALAGNASEQQNCFGFAFPAGCTRFDPPHRMKCYRDAWKAAGCAPDGRKFPVKLNPAEFDLLRSMNLRQIIDQMKALSKKALLAHRKSQLDCFGYLFSKLCRVFIGPFARKCLESIWLDVGCAAEGYKAPSNLRVAESDRLNTMTLVMVRSFMKGYEVKALDLDVLAQYDCYGLQFPRGCEQFKGNFTMDCFLSVWNDAGCIKEGWGHPSNYTEDDKKRLRALTLRQLITRTNRTSQRAHVLDRKAQLACFGMVFPLDCLHYYGPHSFACFVGLWKQAGCTEEGFDNPRNLTGQKRRTLLGMSTASLSAIVNYMQATESRTFGSDRARLECYGMLYPDGCEYYRGPHNLECLETIWEDSGCIESGYYHPKNMTRTLFDRLSHSSIRAVMNYMEKLNIAAERSNNDEILQCFGPIFPPHCKYFRGRHTLECVEGIWFSAGCVREGHRFPQNLTAMQNASLNAMDLHEIYAMMKNYSDRALAGSKAAQLSCYGVVFTRFCRKYHPILSVPCLSDIFKRHCIEAGTLYPGTANKTLLASLWNDKNQKEVNDIALGLQRGALKENQRKEMQCYGLVFPEHCFTFFRDHSIECLEGAWEAVGCSVHGHRAPRNLTTTLVTDLKSNNLRQVLTYMNQSYVAAKDYKARRLQAQWDCFGILAKLARAIQSLCKYAKLSKRHSQYEDKVKPAVGYFQPVLSLLSRECPAFNPPLTIECLMAIWLGVGCHLQGIVAPDKLSPRDRADIWNINLFEVNAAMKKIHADADDRDPLGLLDCYGIFPDNCTQFNGTLTTRCMASVWVSVGCKRTGSGYPPKLTGYRRRQLYKNYNIRKVYFIMLKVLESGLEGNKDDQTLCFGKHFPAVCKVYEPPLPQDCILAIWDTVGCVEQGYDYPENKSSPDYNLWKTLHLGRVQRYIESFRREAEGGNVEAQLSCYGVAFLNGCRTYEGPHSFVCLGTIWEYVGCLEEGYDYPMNQTDFELRMLNGLNRVEVEEHMKETKNISNQLDVQAQLDCYGFRFPNGCKIFEGPHPVLCLDSVRKLVGLSQFPGTLTPARNRTLNAMNLKELIDHMRELSDEIDDELGPFGPTLCLTTYAPLPRECLADIWENQAGCSEHGTGYPGRLNAIQLRNKWGKKNLKQANQTMTELRVEALSPNRRAQIECYGTEINPNCTDFYPPLSRRCLNSLWLYDVGCKRKGLRFPGGLTSVEFDEAWGNYNYKHAREQMILIKDRALLLNKFYQRECNGRDIPLWMYGVTAAAVKFIMLTVAAIVVLVLSYILFRLMTNYPWMGKGKMPKHPSVPHISFKEELNRESDDQEANEADYAL